jgi:hypothetical protein
VAQWKINAEKFKDELLRRSCDPEIEVVTGGHKCITRRLIICTLPKYY